jgi:translation initiation factor 5B
MYGRHFDHTDELVSHITRQSIDLVKEFYRDDLGKEDWMLMVKLKKLLGVE